MLRRMLRCQSPFHTLAGLSTRLTLISRLGSVVAYSRLMITSCSATVASKSLICAASIPTRAKDSLGIALRRLPPSTLLTCMLCRASSCTRRRFISLLALPRPLCISIPEWPPLSPVMLITTNEVSCGASTSA